MSQARKHPGISIVLIALFPLLPRAWAQEKKEFTYTVGTQAVISITNNYGATTIKPSENRQVVITTVSYSDTVSFENEQHGDRINVRAISNRQGSGLVDYTVLVPGDALVNVRSSKGTLHVQGLRGDVILQSETATVEVSDISDAHLHVNTLSGPINLTDIHNSHLDVHSVDGNVSLHNVTASSVEVNSAHGRVNYDGDPGSAGEYKLTSHSGDLEISIPSSSPVEISSHSVNGRSDEDLPQRWIGPAVSSRSMFLKPTISNASRFVLRSFKGRIHVKRP
jgi:DUF4097 and DUF4098 domain-containing protein YvlB